MAISIGTDLLDSRRLDSAYHRFGDRLFKRLFTEEERHHCDKRLKRIESYAKIFSAKEAVLKAIGVVKNISWQDIEIKHLPSGKPFVALYKTALDRCNMLFGGKDAYKIDLSISDEPPYAQAFVVIFFKKRS